MLSTWTDYTFLNTELIIDTANFDRLNGVLIIFEKIWKNYSKSVKYLTILLQNFIKFYR